MRLNNKALLIAVNPHTGIGSVEDSISHLKIESGVFWDVIPPGRRDAPWSHPEIKSGYFYITEGKMVRYSLKIEFVKQWKNIDLNKAEKYIHHKRRDYLKSEHETLTYYAILIRRIKRLKEEHSLNELMLVSTGNPTKLVRNYAIVYDPEWI
jgi:hypothetical protein